MIELLEKIREYPPFSLLDEVAFTKIDAHSVIAYYPHDTAMVNIGQLFDKIFVIIKGSVASYNSDDEMVDIYHEHDTFGGIEYLKSSPLECKFVVYEELICYEIPISIFAELCNEYHPFRDYFFHSLAQKVDYIKIKEDFSSMSDLMIARVNETLIHKVCIVPADTLVPDAIRKSQEYLSTVIIVQNSDRYGIVTDTNLRKYILLQNNSSITVGDIQTTHLLSIKEDELLFNVLMLMTQQSIKHLPVISDTNEIIGIIELIDIVSFFSSQTHLITAQIENSTSLESLILASKKVNIIIDALHSKGVKSRYIAKLISGINRKMYAKLFHFITPDEWHDKVALILLGSEGREEQILRTDQDNAIIFKDGFNPSNVNLVTKSFIEALDEIGYPRCKGNVMMINPKWQQNLSNYKIMIDKWIENPTNDSMMEMAIFFDSICVAGSIELHTDLRIYLIEQINGQPILLKHFAKSIDSFDEALGIFSTFSTKKGHKNEIDIKQTALFPLIHGIRSLSLEFGIMSTNTFDRIKELNNNGFLSREDAQDIIESLEIINTIRLHSAIREQNFGDEITNFVSLSSMGKIQRDVLKDALKTISHFKKLLKYHFNLHMVS